MTRVAADARGPAFGVLASRGGNFGIHLSNRLGMYDYDRRATAASRHASTRSYVVKWQYRGGKPQQQPFPTEDRAESYAKLMLSAAGKQPIYLGIETVENGAVVDTKVLKGTVSPTQKKLVKLRADLARLRKDQAHAVGDLNKAEFDADIEWTEKEIARLGG